MSAEQIVRFSRNRRIEHLTVVALFLLLCLTGFPQKFFTHRWAEVLVHALGGIERARLLHHLAAYGLALVTVIHFGVAMAGVVARSMPISMAPSRKDFHDVFRQLRYYLGTEPHPPLYDRYSYKEKFEYWGLVMGNVIMVGTGLLLSFPLQVTAFLPGVLIPAAKMAHTNEGLMAFLVITIWHMFNVHLNPDAFPFDPAIFSGRIPRERYQHEHPLELARLEGRAPPVDPAASASCTPAPHVGRPTAEGYYLSLERWEVACLVREGDRLPPGPGTWRPIPALLALVLVPALGVGFLLFMPVAGFVVLGSHLLGGARKP